jgi:5-methylcytosine-specific restriction endonuclease McrA
MGYICPYCGEGLPEDELCPCQSGGPFDDRQRGNDHRRRIQMKANGPAEAFKRAEIGDRDRWVCGICQDQERLVDPRTGAPRALSPSIDHVIPLSAGGAHTRANVCIAHLWCNVEKNAGPAPDPEYMRAALTRILDGTPVPEELHRGQHSSWAWPARPRIEYMIALYIAAGRVAADSRCGDPASRIHDAAVRQFGDQAGAAIQRGFEWIAEIAARRAPIDAKWRLPR